MDTPDRSKVAGAGAGAGAATPLSSKFEDSPVFNFINNLSPIQPVRSVDSVHIAHTYQTLNFASLTSIFSSPHANPQKENKSLVRAPFTDLSKQDTFCENVDERNHNSGTSTSVSLSRCTIVAEENSTRTASADKANVIPADESPAVPSSMMQLAQYDAGSPNHNTTPSYALKVDAKFNVDPASVEPVQFVESGIERRKTLFSMEAAVQENHLHEENRDEDLGCDWENLIGDDAEGLLIFNSPIESDTYGCSKGKTMDNNVVPHCSLLSKATENADKLQAIKSDTSNGSVTQNASDGPLPNCSEDVGKEGGTEHASTTITGNCENQVDNQLQRGIRRRCLVFEGAAISKRSVCQDSNHDPSIVLASKGKNFCANKLKPVITAPRLLTGIGLHLNTLSTSLKDRIASNETMASGKHISNMPSPISPLLPITSGQKNLNNSVAVEKDVHNIDRELEDSQTIHDETSHNSTLELSQGSPKKKRRKSENGSESDGCKRCNCKKSKCLKLYCECFAAGVYCSEPCSCQGCFNKPIHEETVLSTRKQIESRNPLAFAPKVIRTSETGQEMGDDDNKTPASARHKRGCNCKKSSCLKKYCECYQGGVGCSLSCRCEGCKNAFGRKDGILPIGEIEQAEEGVDVLEKENDRLGEGQQSAKVQIDEQHSDNILPITPFENCRLSIDLPFFSSAKPPRSSKLSVGSSPGLYGSHTQKSEFLLSQHKFENNLNTIHEDDTPDILRTIASPTNVVKSVSPNSKRVSPPHNAIGPSPARKGGRKLILKSIPSFPSLSNDVTTDCPMSYPDGSLSSSAFS